MTKVSIIIPIYNVEKYLSQCLESIANQTLKDIEIICIDDGSTDNSLNILNEYKNKDKRFVILTQHNEGAANARTKGMKIAKGEYIGFVDSDDWIDLNYYEMLYNKASKEDADIVRTGFKEFYNDRVKENSYNKLIKKRIKNNKPLQRNEHSIVIWNSIYKTEFLRKNKIDYFDTDLPMCHDVMFCSRTDLSARKIFPVYGTFYYYRKGRYGQLITPSLKRIELALKATTMVTELLNSSQDLEEKIYKDAYKRCIWRLDKNFKEGLSLTSFDEEKQTEYLNAFISLLNNYRYNDYPLNVYYLLRNNFKSYKETKTNKFKYHMLKTKKYINFENDSVHMKFLLFGLKLKFKLRTPPPKNGIILKEMV